MVLVSIRTDKPEAEIGLYDGKTQIAYVQWQAHRQLAETIHGHLRTMLAEHGKTVHDVSGIVCFQGPGSFTGLRIGLTVANALASSLRVPIVACQDPMWLETGIQKLLDGEDDGVALPFYGADVHITPQKK
jgi:tRNA threonylcarbamoyladenosine biosynthesis protein TsaB